MHMTAFQVDAVALLSNAPFGLMGQAPGVHLPCTPHYPSADIIE